MSETPSAPWVPPQERAIPPMDHEPGWKASAFTWAMGELILARMAVGETMASITADPRMPAYCTVYRWVKMIPEFAEAYGAMRDRLAAEAIWADGQRQVGRAWRRAHEEKQGWRPRRGPGRRSTYTLAQAKAICALIEEGWSLSRVVRAPGMPSCKAIYRWLRNEPEFRALYVKACYWRCERHVWEIESVAEDATPATFRAAKRQVAWLEGRIGRLTPKKYRALPAPTPEGT